MEYSPDAPAALDQGIPGCYISCFAIQHLPFLSILLPLRIHGDLQVWRHQRINNGSLAGIAM